MNTERIDFISAYCDRWCERCAFTERCSAFACHVAIEMCGDVAEGIELAVGPPQPAGEDRPETAGERLLREMPVPSKEELAEIERAESAREARLVKAPLTKMARTYMSLATAWLDAHRDPVVVNGDAVVRDALEIVGWDAYLVGAKLHRALSGRDQCRTGDDFDDDPVQNDWNGSAKVALISLERSEAAWRVIAQTTGDERGSILADAVGHLRSMVVDEFPDAMAFVRPGFDEMPDGPSS